MHKLIIGIDPGVKTGLAVWDCGIKKFETIRSGGIIEVMHLIVEYGRLGRKIDLIRFEDARKRKWFGNSGREKLQGAGSIKRDCSIWQEFCVYHGFRFEAVAPQKGQTKWDSDYFRKVTGWKVRTNEHSRDAAVLVFGL